jgi:hypothetical protein
MRGVVEPVILDWGEVGQPRLRSKVHGGNTTNLVVVER